MNMTQLSPMRFFPLIKSPLRLTSLVPGGEKYLCRAFPYIACLYMADILYFGTKSVIVLGTFKGVLLAGILTALLCVLAVGAYLGSTIPSFLLLLVYTVHCALSLSGAAMSLVNLSIDIPVVIFVYRLALVPLESAVVLSVVWSEK
jgi:hypothetical protein